jgi:GWxTD domain-containing protein
MKIKAAQKFILLCTATAVGIGLISACASTMKMARDPFFKSFFEKTQMIMTKEEVEIYKRLPDRESKEEFIKEFWEIRDPDPGTEENENKTEFEDRLEYADTWFGVWNPRRGRARPGNEDSARGWDSDRGRIYIVLGPPDTIIYDGGELYRERMISRPGGNSYEQWQYYRFQLTATFVKQGTDQWMINAPSLDLMDAMELSKLDLVSGVFQEDMARRFKFSLAYDSGKLEIKIPVQRISFEETEDGLAAAFRIRVNVYQDDEKIETLEEEKTWATTEEEIYERKQYIIEVPYVLPAAGSYLLDVIVEDAKAGSFAKYRNTVKKKRKENRPGPAGL